MITDGIRQARTEPPPPSTRESRFMRDRAKEIRTIAARLLAESNDLEAVAAALETR